MTPSKIQRYGLLYLLAMAIILLLTLLTARLYLDQQKQQLQHNLEWEMRQELQLLGALLGDFLKKHDYQSATNLLQIWKRTRPDIVETRLLASNGFELGGFRRATTSSQALRMSTDIQYAPDASAWLEMVRDLPKTNLVSNQNTAAIGLTVGAVNLAFAVFLWSVYRHKRNSAELKRRSDTIDRLNDHLRESETRLTQTTTYAATLADSIPSTLLAVDPEGRIRAWNSQAETLTHVKLRDAKGHRFDQMMPLLGGQGDKVRRTLEQGSVERSSRLVTVAGGTIRYSDVAVHPLPEEAGGGAIIRVDDISQRVRFEQMMVQSEKMNVLAALAAGVAQEINSPLSGVLQNCQNISRRLDPTLQVNRKTADAAGLDLERMSDYLVRRNIPEFLDLVRDSAERAGRIIADMLAFSRRSSGGFEKVSAAELVETAVRLASSDYEMKKKYNFAQVEITRDFAGNLPLLHCDRTRIEQVLLNLIRNAVQAMALAETPAPRLLVLRLRQDDGDLLIEVTDNGPGMNEETSQRVFDPFYTTKNSEADTGLGLSVAHFVVVEQHGGDLTIDTRPGHGCRFTVQLPLKPDRELAIGGFTTSA